MSRPITEVLHSLALTDDLTNQLAEVVQGVQDTGKAGALTLTLKVRRSGPGMLAVEPDVKAKIPQHRGERTFWGTPEGSLLSYDPAQGTLDIEPRRPADAPAAAPRTVGA